MSDHSPRKYRREKSDTKGITMVIDGSTVCYAALHSVGHLSYSGRETGVIYGFLKQVLMLSTKFKTDDFIFCWDDKNYHRRKLYSNYKIGSVKSREKQNPLDKAKRDSMYHQMEILKANTLPTMGFVNSFQLSGFEADDLLAYWAKKLHNNNNVILVTDDKDLYQCLDYCGIYQARKKRVITKKKFEIEYGIEPLKWAEAKAIGGCGSDSVQGIRGASDPAKNANSKAILYLKGELTKGKIFDAIESTEGQKTIARNRKLVTLPYPIIPPRRMFKRNNTYSTNKFRKAFDQHRFISFLGEGFLKWQRNFNLKSRSQSGERIFTTRRVD